MPERGGADVSRRSQARFGWGGCAGREVLSDSCGAESRESMHAQGTGIDATRRDLATDEVDRTRHATCAGNESSGRREVQEERRERHGRPARPGPRFPPCTRGAAAFRVRVVVVVDSALRARNWMRRRRGGLVSEGRVEGMRTHLHLGGSMHAVAAKCGWSRSRSRDTSERTEGAQRESGRPGRAFARGRVGAGEALAMRGRGRTSPAAHDGQDANSRPLGVCGWYETRE
ncbi:hypothetical protein C8R43DRAFT_1028126 [Mycena crocata]|nr:hypothetical protein C8R43DRAFT_1028126 [Mycena crocata]